MTGVAPERRVQHAVGDVERVHERARVRAQLVEQLRDRGLEVLGLLGPAGEHAEPRLPVQQLRAAEERAHAPQHARDRGRRRGRGALAHPAEVVQQRVPAVALGRRDQRQRAPLRGGVLS